MPWTDPTLPSPLDAAMQIESAAVYTANGNSPSLNLYDAAPYDGGAAQRYSFAPNEMGIPASLVVNVDAITPGGTNAYSHKVQCSPDNATWTDCSATLPLTATGLVQIGFFITGQYIRHVLIVSGNTSPSITVDSYVNRNAIPGS